MPYYKKHLLLLVWSLTKKLCIFVQSNVEVRYVQLLLFVYIKLYGLYVYLFYKLFWFGFGFNVPTKLAGH